MKRSNSVFFLALLIFICSACEKVINVKLDSSAAQIVIEGEVTTQAGPYTVTVSASKSFDENNTFPGREDAVIEIKDLTSGLAETLKSKGLGVYQTMSTAGIAGHSYQLTVKLNGKTYQATSTIPLTPVKIDQLYAERSKFDSDKIFMVPVFTDPAGKGNYYRLRQWVNNVQVKGSAVQSDDASDGHTYKDQLYYDTDSKVGNPLINQGDLMTAELQCIDKGAYDFFRTLSTTIDQNSSSPANPLSNISGGALGVFNACQSFRLSTKAKF